MYIYYIISNRLADALQGRDITETYRDLKEMKETYRDIKEMRRQLVIIQPVIIQSVRMADIRHHI